MTIIVEDGTIVANANSYIDDAYFQAYALSRGVTLPATESERDILLTKAMDYIEGFRSQFEGQKTDSNQDLQFPRTNVYIDGVEIGKNTIPVELKKAQAQTAIESLSFDLFYVSDGTNVKKEKLDTLEVEYFQGGSSSSPVLGSVDVYLSVLFKADGKRTLIRV
jgi:hypothetical protein